LQNFLELCDTVVIRGVAVDVIKLRLFSFSLLGKAKQWFYKEKDIDTWDKCSKAFLAKFFLLGKTKPYAGGYQVSSRRGWNPSQKLGKVCRNTTWHVPIMTLTSSSSFKASTMG